MTVTLIFDRFRARGYSEEIDDHFVRAEVYENQARPLNSSVDRSITNYTKRTELHSDISVNYVVSDSGMDDNSDHYIISEHGTKRPNYADYVSTNLFLSHQLYR